MIFSVIGKKISNWVLLITKFSLMVIIGSFILSSCTAPRSIRTIQNNSPSENQQRVIEENQDELDPNKYFDLLEEAKSIEPKADQTSILKPLEDQLDEFKKVQARNVKNTSINSKKINDLEDEIKQLKIKLEMFEQSFLSMNEEKPAFGEIEADSEEFVILSDEEFSKKKKTQKKQAVDKPVIKAPKEEKSTKPISSVLENAPKEEVEKLNKLSFDLVTAYIDKRDYQKALKKLKEIEGRIDDIEQKNEVNYLIGESHFGMRQYQNAIQYFIKVLESPNNNRHDVARLMIAESHLATGETALAKENYQALMDTNPKSKFAPKARMMLQQL